MLLIPRLSRTQCPSADDSQNVEIERFGEPLVPPLRSPTM